MGVDLDDGAVDHDDIEVQIPRRLVEDSLNDALADPAVEPLVDAVSGSGVGGQVPSESSGAGDPEDAFNGFGRKDVPDG